MSAVEVLAVLLGVLIGAGALVWFLRRRNAAAGPGGARNAAIDPFGVGEPWRRHVAAALTAQKRYRAHIATLAAGPLQTRMTEIGRQVDRAVEECWEVARRGYKLDGTIRGLDGSSLRARLDRAAEGAEADSLRSQVAALDRIRSTRDQTEQQLRALQARMGELVSGAAELTSDVAGATVATSGIEGAGALGSAVDDVVTQLEALRLATREVNTPGSPGTSATG